MFRADPVSFGPFTKGVNNRLPDFALASDQLRNAVNIDLDNSGHAHRRAGAAAVVAGTSIRSVWPDGDSGAIYFADGTQLKRFIPDGTPVFNTEAVATVTAASTIAYERFLGNVYWTDGTLTGQVVNGVNQAWGIAAPAAVPILTQAAGNLYDGQYQVTYTYRRSTGEESGAPMSEQITIATHNRSDNGTAGIVVSGIPTSADPTVTQVAVYCTNANGTVLFNVATIPNGTSTTTITGIDVRAGAVLQSQFLRPPPAGSALFAHGSRLYIVAGNVLYYTEPFAPNWFSPAENFITFGTSIAVALPVEDGIFVATADEHFFIPGIDPTEMRAQKILGYGAVPGSGVVLKYNQSVAWMGARGFIIGQAGGKIDAVQEEQVAVELATRGVTGYREVNGIRQLVGVLFGSAPSAMTHKDFTAAEARRVATVLPTE